MFLAVTIAAQVGCRSEAASNAVVADSAGVRLIDVSWDDAPVGTVDSANALVVGDEGSTADVEFFGIRSVVALSDSVLVVVDGSSQQIVRIVLSNRTTTRFGRRGDGPLEFRGLSRLIPTPVGHIYAIDYQRRRLVEVTEHGEFLSEHRFPDVGQPGGSLIVFPAGPVTLETLYIAVMPTFSGQRDGRPYRGPGAIVRFLDPSDTLAVFRGSATFASSTGAGGVIFGASTLIAGSADGLWLGDTDFRAVELRSPGRGLITRIRWSTQRSRELTETRIAQFWATIESRLPEPQRAAFPMMKQTLPFADSVPAFGSLVVGPRAIWIGAAQPPEPEYLDEPAPPQEWLVVDHQSGASHRIVTPAGFRLRVIHEDRLIGVHRDNLGVETIRIYPLTLPR